jgi:serralysin
LVTGLSGADLIDLSALDADKVAAGDQAFERVGAFTREAGQLVLRYNPANGETLLAADVDGDGRADFVVRLAGDRTDFDNFVL